MLGLSLISPGGSRSAATTLAESATLADAIPNDEKHVNNNADLANATLFQYKIPNNTKTIIVTLANNQHYYGKTSSLFK